MVSSCAPKVTTASIEELDSLQRSTKKCKTHQQTPNLVTEEVMTEAINEKRGSATSFKEALLKHCLEIDLDNECWADLLDEDVFENRWYKDPVEPTEEEKTTATGPVILVISVSKEELNNWAKPSKNTIIVKVLGKRINYRLLENKLKREWIQHGTMKITDLADDFYLVHLSSIDDYRQTLFEGPWKVADHYLIVHRWRLFFSLTASICQKVAIWIRIPKFPVEFCNEKFLNRLGSSLGTMLKIDQLTSLHSRGKFAIICVELDLEKPLASHFYTCGMKLMLEYEGLHSICVTSRII